MTAPRERLDRYHSFGIKAGDPDSDAAEVRDRDADRE